MIQCIIVDDEPLARQLISSYINQVPEMHCVGTYQTAIEAFAALHLQAIDLIFIDIEMPGISGLNFIKSLKSSPKVIFVTAYAEYAVDAFELDAVDYLVKPVTFERFLKSVQKVGLKSVAGPETTQSVHEATFIFLKIDKRLVKIDIHEIIYIEALGDYLKIFTTAQQYVSYMTMAKIESLLPASKFIRIHRSTIVNPAYIQFIEGNLVRIRDTDLPIGQTYRENLLKKIH